MSPELLNTLGTVASVAVPAVVAFLVGHFHVILKNPSTPAPTVPTPATPTSPVVLPGTSLPVGQGGILQSLANALPHVDPTKPVAPVGQGGLLQLFTLALQGVLASPQGTPAQKASAVTAVVAAIEPFTTEQPVAK